jgi:hypothetical protein
MPNLCSCQQTTSVFFNYTTVLLLNNWSVSKGKLFEKEQVENYRLIDLIAMFTSILFET